MKDIDTLRAIIDHQNAVAKKQFFDKKGNRCWIGVRTLQGFQQRMLLDGGGGVEAMPRYNRHDAVVFYGVDGEPEVWVDPNFANYRGAFAAMVKRHYDFSLSESQVADLDIDHVFARSAAIAGNVGYVRLAGIYKGANRARGAHEDRLGPPFNAHGLAAASVADFCKINSNYLLLGDKGNEAAGVPMMVASGVFEGLIPKDQATQLITRGTNEVLAAFK